MGVQFSGKATVTSRRVAALSLIAGLALADVAAAAYLAGVWQQRHPPGGPAQVDVRQGGADLKADAQRPQRAVGRAP